MPGHVERGSILVLGDMEFKPRLQGTCRPGQGAASGVVSPIVQVRTHVRLGLGSLAILALACLVGSGGAPFADGRKPSRPPWRLKPWDITISPAGEPGDRLIVTGRVFGENDSVPARGIRVFAYQADWQGLYTPPGEDSLPPRLSGTLWTNELGEYRLRTTVPGSYGAPPHLHFEISSDRLQRRMVWVNVFREAADSANHADQRRRSGWNKPSPNGGDAVLTPGASGQLELRWDLHWQRGFKVPGSIPGSVR